MSNRVVFKYKIPSDDQWHEVPNGHVTMVAMQGGYVYIWVEQDPLEQRVTEYRVFGTGHPLEDVGYVVGSVLDGPFVWHVGRKHKPPHEALAEAAA